MSPRRVLVVGGSATKLAASAPALLRQGFEVDRVSTGRSALTLARSVPFHFALLDVASTPSADVEELSQALSAVGPPGHRTRIVLVAPAHQVESLRDRVGRGVDAVLSEDTEPAAAAQVFHEVLGAPPRLDARLPVRLEVSLDEGFSLVFRQTENLSRTGMLVRSPRALPHGTQFSFRMDLPGDRHAIEGKAEVVRHVLDDETKKICASGMRFLSFRSDGEERLQAFVQTAVRDRG